MSKIPLYILTENLNFFYRLKRELDRNSIKYKILNIGSKLPTFSSIILSTSEEISYVYDKKNKLVILPYLSDQNFEKYILCVIAAYRVGFKEAYSNLTFSIDPGTKYIGIATFLDDYFMESKTFYTTDEAITYILKISNLLQSNDSNPLDLEFKFGRGVLSLSYEFLKDLFFNMQSKNIKNIYLIDEISSSKVKLFFNNRKLPKHESAAILLAIRSGLKISTENFDQFYNKIKLKQIKPHDIEQNYKTKTGEYVIEIKKIAEDLINGLLSYREAMDLINGVFEKQKFNLLQ